MSIPVQRAAAISERLSLSNLSKYFKFDREAFDQKRVALLQNYKSLLGNAGIKGNIGS
jgi:hypothetical protein